jgi:glyoxylase-like metal-dependent hydrolase (beta-lactamase superfamily II)
MDKTSGSLHYEFDFKPEIGEAVDILPGVKWLRLPLPFMLGHINVWLLQDGDGWAIVDTGIGSQESRDVWSGLFAHTLKTSKPSRVLVTHMHPDHVGCAGWLCEHFGIELSMSRDEYLLCRVLVSDTGRPVPEEGKHFYRAAGFSEKQLLLYEKMFGGFGKMVSPLPQSFQRMQHGDLLNIGEQQWQVVVGSGHSPEHACLFCPDLNVLISGDQILPTISSNVSVFPTEPYANPLQEWLLSLNRLKTELPDDVLVLPAHGKPFRGAKHRLDHLIKGHQNGLDKMREFCRKPCRAVDLFPVLFKSKISDHNHMMAAGEALAHIHYLQNRGEIQIERIEDGVRWYKTT